MSSNERNTELLAVGYGHSLLTSFDGFLRINGENNIFSETAFPKCNLGDSFQWSDKMEDS